MNEQIRAEFEQDYSDRHHLPLGNIQEAWQSETNDYYAGYAKLNAAWAAWQSAHARYARSADDVVADHKRLVRELDVLINGESGAAQQSSLCDIVAQVRKQRLAVGYAGSVEAALKGIVINNNLLGSDVLLRCQPHTTIPVGTVMISCTHPDVAHDCCVVCGVNILPDRPAFEWMSAHPPAQPKVPTSDLDAFIAEIQQDIKKGELQTADMYLQGLRIHLAAKPQVNQQLLEALLLFVQNSSVQNLVPVTCEIAEDALLSAGHNPTLSTTTDQ